MVGLRSMIGQMLIMGFSGCEVNDKSPVVEWLRKDGLGGVLLFDYDPQTQTSGKNLKNKKQIKRLNEALTWHAQSSRSNSTQLIIAIDYEGGNVDRLAQIDGCIKTKTPAELAALSDDALYEEAEKMALTLQELGFNLNFAPVTDLSLNDKTGIIGARGRSFSDKVEEVVRAASIFTRAFNQHGIACAYKHFPGHGSASNDTHEGFVDVTDTFQEKELIPYQHIPTSPLNMIMTAHVINRKMDKEGLPATLSYPILTGILRQQLAFQGVIVSDDLQMKAISDHFSLDDALKFAINAGSDMLIFGNQLGDISATEVIDRIERLVCRGMIQVARIQEAYHRICQLKASLSGLGK